MNGSVESVIREWITKLGAAKQPHIRSILAELGRDDRLGPRELLVLWKQASMEVNALILSQIIQSSVKSDHLPTLDFWVSLILEAKDMEVGVNLIDVILPFVDITELIVQLLALSSKGTKSQQARAALTAWWASCGSARTLSPPDTFYMVEAVDRARLLAIVANVLPTFQDARDRRSLNAALRCLEKKPS